MRLTTRRRCAGAHVVLMDGKPTSYEINRGSYFGTCDDRADRWYIEHSEAEMVDRRGEGYGSLAHALAVVGDLIDQESHCQDGVAC